MYPICYNDYMVKRIGGANENFKVAEFKEVKLKVAIDSMGKAKVYVLKENEVIDMW